MTQFPPMIAPAVGYRVEGVANGASQVVKCQVEGLLNGVFNLEGDNDMRYYQDNFMSKRMWCHIYYNNQLITPTTNNNTCKRTEVHLSFLAGETPQGPISVSIARDDNSDSYKTVIRTANGNQRLTTPKGNIKPSWWRKLVGAGPSGQGIHLPLVF